MPYLQSDGHGGLVPNSAQIEFESANARNLAGRGPRGVVVDSKITRRVQVALDSFYADPRNAQEQFAETKNKVITLPKVASPLKVHSTYVPSNASGVAERRQRQHESLQGTFLGNIFPRIHRELDVAIGKSQAIRSEILRQKSGRGNLFSEAMKKLSNEKDIFSQQELHRIFQPIEEHLEDFNWAMDHSKTPLRIVWRRVVDDSRTWSIDMWMTYANDRSQAAKMSSWGGVEEAIDPRDRANSDISRLDVYLPPESNVPR